MIGKIYKSPKLEYHDDKIRTAIGELGITKVLTICSQTIMECGHEDLSLAIRVVRNICREKDSKLPKI